MRIRHRSRTRGNRPRARGIVLIEVLVTATIVAIGVLGLAQLQARTAIATMEAQQRSQALVLARDMADRLLANRSGAAGYVGDDYGVLGGTCGTASTVARDRCAWSDALRGASERIGAANTGGLRGGRGCVVQAGARSYRVVVTWQGLSRTAPPFVDCGRNVYGDERQRRAVVVTVELADLSAA